MANSAKHLAGRVYKAAQGSTAWLLAAEKLATAAEIILAHQQLAEGPYFRAVEAASQRALSLSATSEDGTGRAEIDCPAPNYLSAQLLYAFAIENVLKGLIVHHESGLLNETRVSRVLTTHNLQKLADRAAFQVHVQERPVLKALSHIGEWAGRYPIASELKKYPEGEYALGVDPESLLDWGSQHPIMRGFFKRALEDLEKLLPQPVIRFGAVVTIRPPGVGPAQI